MKQFEVVHDATLQLLATIGVRFASRSALEIFAKHGVSVDFEEIRVFPTSKHIEKALSTIPKTFLLYGRNVDVTPLKIGGDTPRILAGGGAVRVHELDGTYTEATWEHLARFTTLVDALPNIDLILNPVDPAPTKRNYYLHIAAQTLSGTSKPPVLQVKDGADLAAVAEMGACVRGSREAFHQMPLFITGTNAEPPLFVTKDGADIIMTAAKLGVPCGIGDYVMMGSTAPKTLAGAIVQRNAVQLAALLLIQLVRPGCACYYTASSGSTDMRTLNPITSGPDSLLIQRISARLGRSFYGLPVWAHSSTDSREPDAQAAAERTAFLFDAIEAGASIIQGPTSMMDGMLLASFAQTILDHDIIGYLQSALSDQIEINADTLATNAIREVIEDPTYRDMKFSGHPHTAMHLSDTAWEPMAFEHRSSAESNRDGHISLGARAASKAAVIIDGHRPEPLEKKTRRRLQAIAEEGARRESY